ncbi:hypothetical protein [Cardinium endosymbiont of Nabis limbatus]|uniref:hypothetical protein n=1 Tax=Cardinium endosymbiont of Nabis limbatus TaxID=3066217 RepID=UPI003AF3A5CA
MELARLPKRSKIVIPILIGIFSFFLCAFTNTTNANLRSIRKAANENSTIILQKIKEFRKQSFHKKNTTLEASHHQEDCQLKEDATANCTAIPIQPTANDKKIKNFYAYDPIGQAWAQCQSFKITNGYRHHKLIDATIDGNPYRNFWAYDLPNQTWHNVRLISYLQQANTQINSDSPAMATKKSALSNHNKPLNDVARDELLEELLGVHTFIHPANPEQETSLWDNFSFDFSIGTGMVFYANRLEHMRLLQREKHDYFFITKTNEVYKPNWFHDTLNSVPKFNESDCIQGNDSKNTTFEGKGLGIPITLGIQYIFWKQLFVGVGREAVFNATKKLVHNDDNIAHKQYAMPKKWSVQGRWFAKCGWYAFSNEQYKFFGDIRLFYVRHLGHMFSTLVTFGDYLHQAVAYNFGLGYEQQLTNYLAGTARLSVELQKFKQFSNKEVHGYNISYKQPAIYLQVGLSIRKYLKNKKDQTKAHKLNNINKLDGLQNLLDLD